jgi:hypothetical protein
MASSRSLLQDALSLLDDASTGSISSNDSKLGPFDDSFSVGSLTKRQRFSKEESPATAALDATLADSLDMLEYINISLELDWVCEPPMMGKKTMLTSNYHSIPIKTSRRFDDFCKVHDVTRSLSQLNTGVTSS